MMRKEKILYDIICDCCGKNMNNENEFNSGYKNHTFDFCVDCFNKLVKDLTEKYRNSAKSLTINQYMVKHEMYIHINNTMSYPLNKRIDIYLTDLVDNDDNYKQGYIFIVRDHNSIEEKIRVFL